MEYRPLSASGPAVSAVGLGGHLFGGGQAGYYESFHGRRFVEAEDLDRRTRVVEAALDEGVNLLAADFDFEARALGRIVRELGALDRVYITSTVEFRVEEGRVADLNGLDAAVGQRLNELGLERLDLPQVRIAGHYGSGLLDDLAGRLEALRDQGKIGRPVWYAGDADEAALLGGAASGRMKVVARALGWLNPSPVRRLLPAVVEQGAGFMAFVPFQKGWLFDLGRQAGVSDEKTARFGLSWALTRPGVTTVLCGAATPDQAAANARAAAWPMTEAEMADVARRLAATEAYAAFYRRIHQAAPQLAVDRRKEPVT